MEILTIPLSVNIHPKCQQAKVNSKRFIPLIHILSLYWTLPVLAIFLFFQVQPVYAANPTEARSKLLAMVKGDIERSLAVEDTTTVPELSSPKAGMYVKGFPSGQLYAVGKSTTGTLGVGLATDTYVPQLVSLNAFGGPIACGAEHALVVDSSKRLWITGLDTHSQYGDGPVTSTSATISRQSAYYEQVYSVAAGTGYSLVLVEENGVFKVVGAGEGSSGELGDGRSVDTNWFMDAKIPKSVKIIEAFNNNSYAITEDGDLYTFGLNQSGSLGVGNSTQVDTPTHVLSGVSDIAAGLNFALALMDDGNVYAMGLNTFGQFGDGTTDSSIVPKLVINTQDIKAVAAGSSFSMFLRDDGSVDAVGVNSYGQIGLGDTAPHYTLETVFPSGAVKIAAGRDHALILTESGALLGAGSSVKGQLGLGNFGASYTYETIRDSGIGNVYGDSNNTYFLTGTLLSLYITGLNNVYEGGTANFECFAQWSDGRIRNVTAQAVWQEDSANAEFELNSGILTVADSTAPEAITITASYFGQSVTKDITVVNVPPGGPLYGMGENGYSQLGLDTTIDQNTPRNITSSNIIATAGGRDHTLYVHHDGAVFVAGRNDYGQLGTGDTMYRSAPTQIMGPGSGIAVGAGEYHSLIVKRDGSAWAAGRNDNGQLGDGSQIDKKDFTKIVNSGAVEVDGGAFHSVIRTSDGAIWTTGGGGATVGQLGNGSTIGSDWPIKVVSSGAEQVVAGQYHTVYRNDASQLRGFGDNTVGQLGLGGAVMVQLIPTTLVSSDVQTIAAGDSHTLYVNSSGNLYGAGQNVYGQLGDGTQTARTAFQQVGSYSNVTQAWAGGHFSIFQDDDDIFGMGDNSRGQFGDNTWTAPNTTPVLLPHQTFETAGTGYAHVLFTLPVLPVIETTDITNITAVSAESGGKITNQGTSAVTAKGVCWGDAANPTISDSCTSDGSGTDSYTSNISGLLANTNYHVRAYATNSSGSGYGQDRSFTTEPPMVSFTTLTQTGYENITTLTVTALLSVESATEVTIPLNIAGSALGDGVDYTLSSGSIIIPAGQLSGSITITLSNDGLPEGSETILISMGTVAGATMGLIDTHTVTLYDPVLPTVSTALVTEITKTSATSGGDVTSEGSGSVTEKGICWGIIDPPTFADTCTTDGSGSGSFTSGIIGLKYGTFYFVRAYATSEVGTVYGNVEQFKTKKFPWLLFLQKRSFQQASSE